MEENRHIEVKVIINNINDRDSISISSNTDGHMEQDLQQMPVTGGIIENFNVICNDRDHGEQYFREIYNLPQSQESSLEDTASQFFIETEANSNTKNVCKFLRKYAMLLYLIIITLTDAVEHQDPGVILEDDHSNDLHSNLKKIYNCYKNRKIAKQIFFNVVFSDNCRFENQLLPDRRFTASDTIEEFF
ncbi:hypothetical protein CWI36_0759p0030 [Hamiltosporidium magnivora]|uniref:Uncharacterized protein n=1 Tax=Hamiltosporidium magnivora TaxID=148818 RepID=A0A4Q9L9S5_9MICR|nr:hypothetical protein CWI36_0759p0030 [Hamiltosporidium magnivora]